MSSFEIDWRGDFYGIYWAYEEGRLVVSTVFEDKDEAVQLAKEIETWSDKFTRMTIIEKNNDIFICHTLQYSCTVTYHILDTMTCLMIIFK